MRPFPVKTLGFILICMQCLLPLQSFARELPDFTGLVDKYGSAVVNISTVGKKQDSQGHGFNLPEIPEESPFHDFFEKFFEQMPEGQQPPVTPEPSSLGSGFIISQDGYVITNNHVVQGAEEIIVRLNDRTEYDAELIGTDQRSDIAVLKIDGKNLPTVKIGQSDKVRVGEWVLAIGTPFGFDHSVTAGIVSAIGRSLPRENYVPFIQTDVAINPGNSGGPLFNLDGEVIGVNSQIYSRTGGFMGLSFAVPIDVTMGVVEQLKEKGKVSRGWLGVLIQDVDGELAESFNMKRPHGALIAKVIPDSPAEKAGFEVGDIVTEFNDAEIRFSSDLPPMVGISRIGKKLPVKIMRRGKEVTLKVVIAELPENDNNPLASAGTTPSVQVNSLNIQVEDLTDEQREELEIEDHGVLVSDLKAGPATEAGIRKGDVILLLNNIKVKDSTHFSELLESLSPGKSIPVLIQRRGGPLFLAIKIPE